MKQNKFTSDSAYEKIIGFSRAITVGNFISVSGTAPIAADGSTACPGNLYKQTKRCIVIMQNAIINAGGKLENVVRTRVYLKDVAQWKQAAKAHREYFSEIRPACTFVEVSGFIKSDWLVELEADCII